MKMLSADSPRYGTFQRPGSQSDPLRTFFQNMFFPKSVDSLEADSRNVAMKRKLNWFDLTLVGIGVIIGSGIFVLAGQAAGNNAGPAIVISFLIAGVASGLAVLCYAEMASMIPVAGSSYTYAYATLGELMAWMIGWDTMLENVVGAAAVSVGWSSYVTSFIRDVGGGAIINDAWTSAPIAWNETVGGFYLTGKYVNVPAVVIVLSLGLTVILGIKESALVNSVIVSIKVLVVLIFVFASIKWIDPENWTPFVPEERGFGHFGVSGIFQGATVVFFAYAGFSSIATAAQESRNPQRDIPIGLIVSLVVCTILYVAVCLCMTGLIPYTKLLGANAASPMANAAAYVGQPWLAIVTELGAIAGISSVVLVILLSLPRVVFCMARDGLLPEWTAYIHPRLGTPVWTTIIAAVLMAILSGVFPIGVLGELTSVGTLSSFVLVSLGVMILRIRRPDLPRQFRVPLGPYVIPLLSALCSTTLLALSTKQTKIRLLVWMAIGLVFYFSYGRRHSKLQRRLKEQRGYQVLLDTETPRTEAR